MTPRIKEDRDLSESDSFAAINITGQTRFVGQVDLPERELQSIATVSGQAHVYRYGTYTSGNQGQIRPFSNPISGGTVSDFTATFHR